MRTKSNTQILILLFVGVLMAALDISIVGPAIPSIEKTVLMNQRDLSWIFSIYVLFNLVGISLMAKLSDFFGRRWIYLLSAVIFGAGSLVVASSHDITLLLVGRAIQGFGSSGIFPVAAAVVGDVFPVEKRGRALGLLGAVFAIAFMLGPFIAGVMLIYFSWNSLFLINLPVVVLLIVWGYFILPSKRMEEKIKFDSTGVILLGIILASYAVGINNIHADHFMESLTTLPVLPLLLLAGILTPILVILEKTTDVPVLDVKLFRSRQVLLVGFIAVGLGLFQSSIVFLPKMAVALFGVEPSRASFMLLPVVIAAAIGSPIGGRMVDKIGSRIIIFTGLLIATVALFLLSVVLKNIIFFYCAEGLLGLGLAIRASLSYIMLNEVSVKERASTQAVLLIFISLGQLTGSALVGALTSSVNKDVSGFGLAFLVMGILSFFLVIASFFLRSRKKELESHKIEG
ncbi:MAG: MFS transporter [Bacteroidetes bacterium]|nr:MFS transporter [Bacteroidota bacterium]